MRSRLERRSQGGKETANTYIAGLTTFFRWLGQTPEELLAGMEDGTANMVEIANDYLDHLHERDLAPSTLCGHINAIKKLVEVNTDVMVNWKRVETPKVVAVEEDTVPTKAIIRRVLFHTNLKERAIILVAASSGMRGGTMAKLAMEDLDLTTFPDIIIVRVPATKSKNAVKYVTFISPEAREALEAYLSTRGDLKPEDPVFTTRVGDFYSRADKLARRWIAPLEKAGLGQKKRKFRLYRFHVLKKFFRTAMEYGGVSKSYRERMLGHQGEYLDNAYFGPEFDKLVEQYRQAIPHLTVEETGVSEERVANLEEELAEMTRAFETMKGATVGRMMRQLEAAGVDTSKTPLETAREMGVLERLRRDEMSRGEIEALVRGDKMTQKVIAEGELVAHLSGGWRFVAQLNNGSGKIVVER